MASIGRARRMMQGTFLCAAVVLVPGGGGASAAVRICKPQVSSGPVFGISEQAARKDALTSWKAKAGTYGEPYTGWRIAASKLLKCLPKGTGFECLASARPCTIEQAPDRRELRQKRLGI